MRCALFMVGEQMDTCLGDETRAVVQQQYRSFSHVIETTTMPTSYDVASTTSTHVTHEHTTKEESTLR